MFTRTTLIAAAVFLTPMAAAEPLAPGQWGGSFSIGADFPVGGDVHGGAVAPVASLAALNPNLPAASAELRIQSRSFDDIYGEALTYSLEATRGLTGDREVFATIGRTEASEGRVQVGTAFVPALSASLPVFGKFGDYNATSFEVGVRQYFGETGGVRPYVAGRIGAARTDEIRASFTVPVPNGVGTEPNDIALNNVPFYADNTAVTVGVDVGLSYAASDRLVLSVETGLRYTGDLDGDDSAIGGLGLGGINNTGARTSVPIRVRARLAF
ncbi:MAG: hypothetical protein ACOYKM_11900 [Caulobacterales bacterium]|jgi:hypothetical protein